MMFGIQITVYFLFDVSEDKKHDITDFLIEQHKREESLGNLYNRFELQISGKAPILITEKNIYGFLLKNKI